jgi:hypothetical protein
VLPLLRFDLTLQHVEHHNDAGTYSTAQHEERAFDGTHGRASLQHESGAAGASTAVDESGLGCASVCIRSTSDGAWA